MSALLGNLLRFGQVLRELGLEVPAAATIGVAEALAHVDVGRRSDFYFTLRALLVHRQADLAVFDEAFRVFWRRPANPTSPTDLRSLGERRRLGPPERDLPEGPGATPGSGAGRTEPVARVVPRSYSDRETLRHKDFAAFTEEEMREARAMLDRLRWAPDLRRTHRWAPGGGRAPDWRRLLAASARRAGEPIDVPMRTPRWRERPLVVLCDVSGSMERYARMLIHFVRGLAGHLNRVEAFVFATRLTRITHDVRLGGTDRAIAQVVRGLADWGGGTRIGDAVRTFNVEWARRVTGRAPVVLLISDGWDRGDPAVLRREMARLARRSWRLIWLNPLLGSPEYQPLTRGMQAALPFIDDFLPVHNLVSLERLAVSLDALASQRHAAGRSVRPRRPSGPAVGGGDARRAGPRASRTIA